MTVKKIVWSMISILMVSMLLVVACSDDNNDSSIVGTWHSIYDGMIYEYDGMPAVTVRFNSNGTFTETAAVEFTGLETGTYTGTYSISGDTMTYSYDGGTTKYMWKFTVSSSELCLVEADLPTEKFCFRRA